MQIGESLENKITVRPQRFTVNKSKTAELIVMVVISLAVLSMSFSLFLFN